MLSRFFDELETGYKSLIETATDIGAFEKENVGDPREYSLGRHVDRMNRASGLVVEAAGRRKNATCFQLAHFEIGPSSLNSCCDGQSGDISADQQAATDAEPDFKLEYV